MLLKAKEESSNQKIQQSQSSNTQISDHSEWLAAKNQPKSETYSQVNTANSPAQEIVKRIRREPKGC